VAGEFGGGSWYVERSSGPDDLLAYRDWRVTLGVERRIGDYITTARLEVGYVFNREVEYDNSPGDQNLDSTIIVRGVLGY
jgi:hypothetical protein